MIRVRSMQVDYEALTAVRDFSLDIQPGEIYGLVGPNGAGKTTSIKAIAGLLEPTHGEIIVDGVDSLLHPETVWAKVGYVPDFAPFYENLKVWEYLEVFAAAYLISRAERPERIRREIERVNFTEKRDTLVNGLSRGMRQRLALAKTLVQEPKVLLLDEPASGLDPMARIELREILKDLAQGGLAILISSHILSELSDLCTAVGIMERGKMVVSGNLDEVRQRMGSQGTIIVRLSKVAGSDPQMKGRLQKHLEENSFVSGLFKSETADPLMLKAFFKGEDEEARLLLKKLIDDGIAVCEFNHRKENLEDLFMKVGAKEVS